MSSIVQELETLWAELDEYYWLRWQVIVEHEDLTKEEHKRVNELHNLLAVKIGAFKNSISEAAGMPQMAQEDVWIYAMSYSQALPIVNSLDQVIQATSLALGKIKRDIEVGKREAQTGDLPDKSRSTKSEPPRAFIAHEGETEQLSKLKSFLDTLGIKYFIAEAEASDGRSIEGQVDWTQAEADFAICLATKGKAINRKTGKHYMALNVADEIGRARGVFGNRIILLVQKGVEVHTNIREIVWATFTTQSMDEAFIKIIKELRSWGFIQVAKHI
jgi:predicted nucleotide-binding protein